MVYRKKCRCGVYLFDFGENAGEPLETGNSKLQTIKSSEVVLGPFVSASSSR